MALLPCLEPHCPHELGRAAVELDVDQHDVRPEATREADGLVAARGLADDLDAVPALQQRRDAGADQSLCVDDDHADGDARRPRVDEREGAPRGARDGETSGQDA